MDNVLHHRIASIYRLGTLLSLFLMAIATIELFVWGAGAQMTSLALMPIVHGILQGDALTTYYAAVVVLIFSPMLNLLVMALTYFQKKDIRFGATATIVLTIMILAMAFKLGH